MMTMIWKSMIPKVVETIRSKMDGPRVIISEEKINEFFKEHDVGFKLKIINDKEVEFIYEKEDVESR